MNNRLILQALLSILASTASAQTDTDGATVGMMKKDSSKSSDFSGSFLIEHSEYANQNLSPSTALTLGLRYKTSENTTFSVSQTATKLYEINEGEEELQPSDTLLTFSHSLGKQSENGIANFSYGLRATLPVSEYSRTQKHRTVAGITPSVSRSFFDEKLSAGLGLLYYYHVNDYKSMDQDDGGRYFIQQQYGASASISYQLPFDLTASWYSYYRQRQYENENIAPNHRYYFDGSLAFQATEKIVATVGFSQVDLAEKYGSVDVNLYDIEATSYYGSVSYTF